VQGTLSEQDNLLSSNNISELRDYFPCPTRVDKHRLCNTLKKVGSGGRCTIH
jgi:hypothetical protein